MFGRNGTGSYMRVAVLESSLRSVKDPVVTNPANIMPLQTFLQFPEPQECDKRHRIIKFDHVQALRD